MADPTTEVDVVDQVLRCNVCGDTVPIPLGAVDWVVAVIRAFDKAHPAKEHTPGRTMMAQSKQGAH